MLHMRSRLSVLQDTLRRPAFLDVSSPNFGGARTPPFFRPQGPRGQAKSSADMSQLSRSPRFMPKSSPSTRAPVRGKCVASSAALTDREQSLDQPLRRVGFARAACVDDRNTVIKRPGRQIPAIAAEKPPGLFAAAGLSSGAFLIVCGAVMIVSFAITFVISTPDFGMGINHCGASVRQPGASPRSSAAG